MPRIKGGVFVTEIENQKIINTPYEGRYNVLTDVSVENIGELECNVIINEGDKILLRSGEYLEISIPVESVVVVESGATVRVVGVE